MFKMFKYTTFLFCTLFFLSCAQNTFVSSYGVNKKEIIWEDWSNEVFVKAKEQNRLVLLDLKAVWCHWCHVMDQTTYSDPEVMGIISEHYVAIRVDQDSHPSLANRYRRYGWPATIVFNADGEELLKSRGYIDPNEMSELLLAIYQDPKIITEKKKIAYSQSSNLDKNTQEELLKRYKNSYDQKLGGLNISQKYLEMDSLEYALHKSSQDDFSKEVAIKTLAGTSKLIDPVWGGMYQYSTHRDWDHPHYEKIMTIQARAIKAYVLAFAVFGEKKYWEDAQKIKKYLNNFLMSPEGTFYVSQDADIVQGQKGHSYFASSNEERLKQGIPRIDKTIYARENGWAIEAIALMAQFSPKKDEYISEATRAANWILQNHRKNMGFFHGDKNPDNYYLSNNLAMAKALLQLYIVTSDKKWLQYSQETMDFIMNNFQHDKAGFYTGVNSKNIVLEPTVDIQENIDIARFANYLYHYTREKKYRQAAEHAFQYLATPEIATSRLTEAGILTIHHELTTEPIHVTVVGSKNDPLAQNLFYTAISASQLYKIVEFYDPNEGLLPNMEIQFPPMSQAVAFLCADQSCSAPIETIEDLQSELTTP